MTATPAQPAIKTMNPATHMPNPQNQASTPSISSSSSHKLDPIAVLREELAAAAMRHGVERMEDLTEALVNRVVQRLGGTSVYVRNARVLQRERLAQEVRAKFNGRNTRALAREYGVSVRWVQKLLEAGMGA